MSDVEFEKAYEDMDMVRKALDACPGSLKWHILSVEPYQNKGLTYVDVTFGANETDLMIHMSGAIHYLEWEGSCYLNTPAKSLTLSQNETKTDDLFYDDLAVWLLKIALKTLEGLVDSGFDVLERSYKYK